MEQLQEALRLFRRRWWLIPLTALVAAVIILAVNLTQAPRYRTSARFLVVPAPLEDPGDLVDSTEALNRPAVATTYAEVFNSPTLQQHAAATTGAVGFNNYAFSTVVLPESSVLQLSVRGPDPAVAQDLANALGAEVIAYLQKFKSVYELHQLDPAPLVEDPYAPQTLRDTAIALILGAIVGAVLVVGFPYLFGLLSLPALDASEQEALEIDRGPYPSGDEPEPGRLPTS